MPRPTYQTSNKYRPRSKSKYLKPRKFRISSKFKKNNVLTEKVKEANSIVDLLKPAIFKEWQNFKITDSEEVWNVECFPSMSSDSASLRWAFELCKSNTKEMYESTVGWNDETKFAELTHSAARYIFIRNADTRVLIAFSHFRFDMDYGDVVLYCYELHVIPEFRGKGVGRFVLSLLERLAFSNQMNKVVLTVFKANEAAIRFYRRYGYSEDATCLEDTPYLILSKSVDDWRKIEH